MLSYKISLKIDTFRYTFGFMKHPNVHFPYYLGKTGQTDLEITIAASR